MNGSDKMTVILGSIVISFCIAVSCIFLIPRSGYDIGKVKHSYYYKCIDSQLSPGFGPSIGGGGGGIAITFHSDCIVAKCFKETKVLSKWPLMDDVKIELMADDKYCLKTKQIQ